MSRKLTDEEKQLNKLIHELGRLAMQEALLGKRFDLVKNRKREVESAIAEHNTAMQNAGNGGFPRLNELEKSLCQSNNFISAIKEMRQRLNIGLKEAKDAVDYYRQNNNLIRQV